MAWLDEEWTFSIQDENGREVMVQVMSRIASALKKQKIPIAHLKFLLEAGDYHGKFSLTTLEQAGWLNDLPQLNGSKIKLLINGRVQMDAGQFRDLVNETIKSNETWAVMGHANAFHPDQPQTNSTVLITHLQGVK